MGFPCQSTDINLKKIVFIGKQDLQTIYYGLHGLDTTAIYRDSVLRALCKIVRYERLPANAVLFWQFFFQLEYIIIRFLTKTNTFTIIFYIFQYRRICHLLVRAFIRRSFYQRIDVPAWIQVSITLFFNDWQKLDLNFVKIYICKK